MQTPDQTPVATSDKIIDQLPKPIRHLLELIGIASAIFTLVGWIASTFSLVAKMTFWSAAWAAMVLWSMQLPTWAEGTLLWLGANCHWLAEQFRALIYPAVAFVSAYFGIEIPPIAIDILSIGVFGVMGAARIAHLSTHHEDIELGHPFEASTKAGLLFPIVLVQLLPMSIFVWFYNTFGFLSGPIDALYWWLEKLIGEFAARLLLYATLCLPFLVAFPLAIYGIELIYITLLRL